MIPARCWETAPRNVRSFPIPLPLSLPLLLTGGPPASAGRGPVLQSRPSRTQINPLCAAAISWLNISLHQPQIPGTHFRNGLILSNRAQGFLQSLFYEQFRSIFWKIHFLSATHPPPKHLCHLVLSHVQLFVTPWTIYNLLGSSVHGILQARILEWEAIPSSRESSRPRDWTRVSYIAGGFFIIWATIKCSCLHFDSRMRSISSITWSTDYHQHQLHQITTCLLQS